MSGNVAENTHADESLKVDAASRAASCPPRLGGRTFTWLAARAPAVDNDRTSFLGTENRLLKSRFARSLLAIVAIALLSCAALAATKKSGPPPKRARPPKWSPDVLDAFFPDARAKLVGERPAYEKATAVGSSQAPNAPGAPTSSAA